MSSVIAFIRRIGRFATGAAFLVMIVAVLIQIGGRLIGNSPVWSEELTRFGLLYLVAFGAGLSFRTGDLVNVDLFCESLPGVWPKRLRFIAAASTAVLSGALIVPALKFTEIGVMQTSPALGWRMDFIHATVLILLASLFLFSILRVIAMISGQSDGRVSNQSGGQS